MFVEVWNRNVIVKEVLIGFPLQTNCQSLLFFLAQLRAGEKKMGQCWNQPQSIFLTVTNDEIKFSVNRFILTDELDFYIPSTVFIVSPTALVHFHCSVV